MRILFIAFITVVASSALSKTLPKVPIEQLLRNADVVAIMSVQSGEIYECGARYRATVLTPIKGLTSEKEIEFGPFTGTEIGGKYLLFLTRSDRNYAPVASTNSLQENEEEKYEKRCRGKLPTYRVMFDGVGSVDIRFSSKLGYSQGAIVPTKWIGVPKDIKTYEWSYLDSHVDGANMWVSETELVDFLRKVDEKSH